MKCESEELLDGYLDDELDLRTSLSIERHVRQCVHCQSELDELNQLRDSMAGTELYFRAPLALRQRVRASISPRQSPWWAWAAISLAAAGMAMALLFFARPADSHLEDAALSAHLRSLEPNHLIDVVSSDTHTVKPWFNGKVDFSPPVTDLKAQGFELIGGRLDYLYRDQAVALVYKRRQHIINLFVVPSPNSDSNQRLDTRRGYHLIEWTRAGFQYCAVSDLNMHELGEFQRLL